MTQRREATEAKFADLGLEDLELAVRLWTVKQMLEHRQVSHQEVAKAADRSTSWVRHALQAHDTSGVHRMLDRIETAVTAVSDSRGGVPKMCCTVEGYVAQVQDLDRRYDDED